MLRQCQLEYLVLHGLDNIKKAIREGGKWLNQRKSVTEEMENQEKSWKRQTTSKQQNCCPIQGARIAEGSLVVSQSS